MYITEVCDFICEDCARQWVDFMGAMVIGRYKFAGTDWSN